MIPAPPRWSSRSSLPWSASCSGPAAWRWQSPGSAWSAAGPARSGRLERDWFARGLARLQRVGRRWGPTLDRDPVLWREWHRNQATRWSQANLGRLRADQHRGGLRHGLGEADADSDPNVAGLAWNHHRPVIDGRACSCSAPAPRRSSPRSETRGSLDVLMSTPVSTRAILRAKWWGAFRLVPWLMFWPDPGGRSSRHSSVMWTGFAG